MSETALIAFSRMRQAPEKIRVFRTGEIFYKDRKHTYTRDDLGQMVVNFERERIEIPVDYEHQTLSGGKAPAAGWVKKLEAKGDELWAAVEWTEKAHEMIEKREYRYLSPVIVRNMRDGRSGENIGTYLHSVAVTNQPHIRDLFDLAASEISVSKEPVSAEVIRGADSDRREVIVMDMGLNEDKEKESMRELMKALGLPEDATEQDALKQVKSLKRKGAAKAAKVPEAIAEAIGAEPDAPPQEVAATIREAFRRAEKEKKETNASYLALRRELESFWEDVEKEKAEREVDALVGRKILPKDRDTYVELRRSNPEIFQKVTQSLAEMDMLSRRVPRGDASPGMVRQIKGIDPDSLELDAKAEAYSKKYGVPYGDALAAVSKGDK